jgi:hypothetical protein
MASITRFKGQKVLAIIWLTLAAVLIGLCILYAGQGSFGDQLNGLLYNWLASTLAPNLSLIVGSIILSAASEKIAQEIVDGFFFRVAIVVSLVYFVLLFVEIFSIQNILLHQINYLKDIPFDQQNAVLSKVISTKIQGFSLWVSLVQGTVSAFLGIFFIKKK